MRLATISCDPSAGLYPRTDGGDGCMSIVQVSIADHWQEPALFFAVAVLVCLAALVVAQVRS